MRDFGNGGGVVSEWISVNDELPDDGKLIIMKLYGIAQRCIYYRTSDEDGYCYQDATGEYEAIPESEALEGDMHWMYLPE